MYLVGSAAVARIRAGRPSGRDDAHLVTAARSGDRRAFGELYGRHYSLVNAIVLARATGNDVRDIVQEVFATALRELHRLEHPAAFARWVAAIARNKAGAVRRRARPVVPLDVERMPVGAPPPEAFVVLDALRNLPGAYRETVALRLVAGMTGPEIAERMGMTPGSVRVNLCRGLKMLRAAMGGRDDA